MEDSQPVMFNSGMAISMNISIYFRQATICMNKLDLYGWYKALESAYCEGEFKFTKKKKPDDPDGETEDIQKQFKAINPHNKAHYDKLKTLHMTLRRYLGKHGFLMPQGDNPRMAVYR